MWPRRAFTLYRVLGRDLDQRAAGCAVAAGLGLGDGDRPTRGVSDQVRQTIMGGSIYAADYTYWPMLHPDIVIGSGPPYVYQAHANALQINLVRCGFFDTSFCICFDSLFLLKKQDLFCFHKENETLSDRSILFTGENTETYDC